VTLIRERLHVEPVTQPGKMGEFEVFADGESVVKRGGNWLTRSLGAGYPDLEEVVARLAERAARHKGTS
jgi:hypothetical protein